MQLWFSVLNHLPNVAVSLGLTPLMGKLNGYFPFDCKGTQ